MIDFVGFLILLAISTAFWFIAIRLVPLAMPQSRIKTIALGLVAGFAGHLAALLGNIGPEVSTVRLVGAVAGVVVVVLFAGMLPFLKIMVGKA